LVAGIFISGSKHPSYELSACFIDSSEHENIGIEVGISQISICSQKNPCFYTWNNGFLSTWHGELIYHGSEEVKNSEIYKEHTAAM